MLDLDTLLAGLEVALYPQRWLLTDWVRCPAGGDRSGEPVALPVVWGGYDQTVWFFTTVVLPAPAGRTLVLRLEVPEGLVYLNGRPYQGVDVNHTLVWLPPELEPGTVLEVGVEAYSGRRDDPQTFALAELAVWDAEVHRLIVALQLLRDDPEPAGRDVLSAILSLFAGQETQDWRAIVPQALSILPGGREGAEAQPGTVHLIGHSHIDVVWLWRLAETRRKCARTFSTALRLMAHCPTFRFTQSQAQLYALVKNDYPDLYREIQAQVAAGRWEVEGAVWVEPDGNLPSGESWVRQLLFGQRFFQREFGVTCRVLWLPDTFGYHGALPQILRQAGVDYFCTTKLNWNDTTVFPLDTFWWEGIDGTRLLSHIPPVGLEGLVRVADLRKSWDTYAQQAACPHVLQTYGYGDGGGGPTLDHVVAADLWPHLGPRPAVQVSSVRAFFQAVAQTATDLPVWQGELYLEKHRGTYTTHGWIKQENRRLERALYTAELLASLRAWQTGDWDSYPTASLAAAWEGVLLNQFHDILPGTFIGDAYPDIQATYAEVQAQLDQVIADLESSPLPAGRCTVFNALTWHRGDYLTLPLEECTRDGSGCQVAGHGQPLNTQVLLAGDMSQSPGLLIYLPDVPPWGTITLAPEPTGRPLDSAPIPPQTRVLETPYYLSSGV